jgi:2-iminobutanoate/2-iminopropanoate deaminase
MKEIITSEHAPAAVGPYSQAVQFSNLVFTAGQIGLDPATGKMVTGGVEAQAQQALKNLAAVLESAGTGFANVIKTVIFLRYMKDFGAVNAIYAEAVGEDKPARSTVAVAALPLGALVEIEMIAFVDAAESEAVIEIEEAPATKKEKKEKKGKKGKKGKK